jgi:hypothetical protein
LTLNNFTDCKIFHAVVENNDNDGFTAATGTLGMKNIVLNLY